MVDELALARQPLTSDDIITYVLVGLGQDYDSLASIITSRLDPVSLKELYSLLLIYESWINHNNQPFDLLLLQIGSQHNLSSKPANLELFNTPIEIVVAIVVEDMEDILNLIIPANQTLLSVRYASNQDIVLANAITALIYLIRINTIQRTNHKHCLLPTICKLTKNGIPTQEPPIISQMT